MKSRFWKLLLALSLAALAQPSASPAQAPTPAPTPATTAYVRFWCMAPAPMPTLELVHSGNPKDAIAQASPRNYFASYEKILPGAAVFTVFRAGDRNAPIGKVSLTVRGGSFTTLLVAPAAGQALSLQAIDDTPSEEKKTRLTVRSFLPPGTEARLIFDRLGVGPVPISNEPVKVLRDVPATTSGYTIEAADGKVLGSGGELSFAKHPQATILVFLNPEGMVRARAVLDGVAQ